MTSKSPRSPHFWIISRTVTGILLKRDSNTSKQLQSCTIQIVYVIGIEQMAVFRKVVYAMFLMNDFFNYIGTDLRLIIIKLNINYYHYITYLSLYTDAG